MLTHTKSHQRTPSTTSRNNDVHRGGPKLFTPWMALQDQELAQEN